MKLQRGIKEGLVLLEDEAAEGVQGGDVALSLDEVSLCLVCVGLAMSTCIAFLP